LPLTPIDGGIEMLDIPPVSDGLRVLSARYSHRNLAFS